MKIRAWDTVEVTEWKNRNTRGEVLKVLPETNKVIVKDVNIVTRHMKKQGTTPGQIVKFEKAIDASNVSLVCPITDKITKIGFVTIEDKWVTKKFRYSKKAVSEQGKEAKDCIIK